MGSRTDWSSSHCSRSVALRASWRCSFLCSIRSIRCSSGSTRSFLRWSVLCSRHGHTAGTTTHSSRYHSPRSSCTILRRKSSRSEVYRLQPASQNLNVLWKGLLHFCVVYENNLQLPTICKMVCFSHFMIPRILLSHCHIIEAVKFNHDDILYIK